MNSLVKKLSNLTLFKDTVAVIRGLYRVGEGAFP